MPANSLSVAAAFKTTLDLFETGVSLMRQNLRRQHPTADNSEIERLLREWLRDRPGAKYGDSSGQPVAVTTRLV